MPADPTYDTLNYMKQGGAELVIGGTLTILAGATVAGLAAIVEQTALADLTENGGAIGGSNNGDLPDLTATYVARTGASGGTANGAYEDEGTLSTTDTYSDAAVNTVVGKLKNNIAELAAVVAELAADNVALRAAVREEAAKTNAALQKLRDAAVIET